MMARMAADDQKPAEKQASKQRMTKHGMLAAEFKTMRLSDHYFPEDFLAFEQSFAAHCQYTHLIDNAIDMVQACVPCSLQAMLCAFASRCQGSQCLQSRP